MRTLKCRSINGHAGAPFPELVQNHSIAVVSDLLSVRLHAEGGTIRAYCRCSRTALFLGRRCLHLCWGNYEGPHHRDIPLRELLPVALKAKPQALSFEGANPRHEHEWAVFRDISLPDDRVIIPGVLDSTTNFIEHPELVAQRIVRYAEIVGRERVIAGSDCGFATFARSVHQVEPEITWAKLKAMTEGARLASKELWK